MACSALDHVSSSVFWCTAASQQNYGAVLPELFYTLVPLLSPEAYRRVIRQYKQTFRKAGITEVDSHKVKPYPDEHRGLWKRVKTRLKVEQTPEHAAPEPNKPESKFSRLLGLFSKWRKRK